MPEKQEQEKVYTVTEITRGIKRVLERECGSVWVEGELSNVSQPASGHYYITIKDANAQISAVMFRGSQRGLSFQPKDGMVVRAFGEISVYERRGNYQLIVRKMQEGGKGSLQAQFEALKKSLAEEGLFLPERKQPLPVLPRHVGIVTSATGAAIRDILNVISRRFPNLHIVLAPAKVQGEGSAEEIAAAIDLLDERGGLDAMIVGRGGGSLEDLWCFNEEVVARAIARCSIPVISAVGHEVDFTIADFVADLRAPTPSAAAELVVGRKEEFEARLDGLSTALSQSLRTALLAARNRLNLVSGSYVFREPANMVGRLRQDIDGLRRRMEHGVVGGARDAQQRLDGLWMRMDHGVREAVSEGRQVLADAHLRLLHQLQLKHQSSVQDVRRLTTQLRALNPLEVLDRGYSVTRDADGRILASVKGVSAGTRIYSQLADGVLESEVQDVEEK